MTAKANWLLAFALLGGAVALGAEPTGAATVESNDPLDGVHRVYNLEVATAHSYLVSRAQILVHNDCFIKAGMLGRILGKHGAGTNIPGKGQFASWVDESRLKALVVDGVSAVRGRATTDKQGRPSMTYRV